MNRIQPWAVSPQPTRPGAQLISSKLHQGVADGFPHHLFTPLHYEANFAYPLLVWLHSDGGDETEVGRVMPHLSMRNYAAASPRGTVNLDGNRFGWDHTAKGISQAVHRVFEVIENATERFNVAPDRVFLAGFGSSGTMALRIALRNPEHFASAISCCGAFPTAHAPLARLNEVRKLPLFLAHGQSSDHYGVDEACSDLRLFHSAGLSVSIRQYPGGDFLDTQMLHDLNAWMMEIASEAVIK